MESEKILQLLTDRINDKAHLIALDRMSPVYESISNLPRPINDLITEQSAKEAMEMYRESAAKAICRSIVSMAAKDL
jgi:hypothetical protein